VEIKRSYVPREAVEKVSRAGLDTFKQLQGRNPSASEAKNIRASVVKEAEKLNRGGK